MKAMISAAAAAAAGLAAPAVAGCTSGNGAQGAAAPVTRTVTSTSTVIIREQATSVAAPTVTPTVTAPAATVTQTAAAPAPTQASSSAAQGKGQVIARFNGSGTLNTRSFTTPGNWALSWSYWGCPDGASNFVVTEYNADGSIDPNGVSVNELGTGRGPVATYAYSDAGTHYLSVDTEGCSWSLVPVTV
jgi:hypothetical protein